MTTEQYLQRYEENIPMFDTLFNTHFKDIREGLADLLANENQIEVAKNGVVHKYSMNDQPYKIEIWYYNSGLILTPIGIDYKPEHGEAINVIYFKKDFKL